MGTAQLPGKATPEHMSRMCIRPELVLSGNCVSSTEMPVAFVTWVLLVTLKCERKQKKKKKKGSRDLYVWRLSPMKMRGTFCAALKVCI